MYGLCVTRVHNISIGYLCIHVDVLLMNSLLKFITSNFLWDTMWMVKNQERLPNRSFSSRVPQTNPSGVTFKWNPVLQYSRITFPYLGFSVIQRFDELTGLLWSRLDLKVITKFTINYCFPAQMVCNVSFLNTA